MLAVLENAVAALLKNVTAVDVRGRQHYDEASAWVAADDTTWLFSFASICHALDLNPACLRAALERRCRQHAAGEMGVVTRSPFRRAQEV